MSLSYATPVLPSTSRTQANFFYAAWGCVLTLFLTHSLPKPVFVALITGAISLPILAVFIGLVTLRTSSVVYLCLNAVTGLVIGLATFLSMIVFYSAP